MANREYTNHKGIKSALSKPPEKGQLEYRDTTKKGLYFRVYSTGFGAFVHRYKFKLQRRVFTLPGIELHGSLPERKLSAAIKQAHAIHEQQRGQLSAGIDPAIERDLQAQEIAAMPTVRQFRDIYLDLKASGKKSLAEDKRILDVDVVPALGTLDLNKVMRAHIIALLDKKQRAGRMAMRNNLISLLSAFFDFAVERGHIDSNPVSGIKKTKQKSRDRSLTDDEIRFFWQMTGDESNMNPSTRLALRLILITAQRPGEVCQLHESQLNGDLWTMDDTKNGRAHVVPLSPLALQVVEEAQPHSRNGVLLPNTKGVVMSKDILPKCMKRLLWPDAAATPHDLRRTAITEISRLGFNRMVQDKIANHVDNSVGGIYDRHDYLKEKRQALEAWSRKLEQIVTGQVDDDDNVVPLRAAS